RAVTHLDLNSFPTRRSSDLDIELNAIIGNKKAKDNSVHIALNTQPLWDLTFNVGAAKFEADLRNHKVSRMEMNSGAANVHVTLGDRKSTRLNSSHVKISYAV